LLEKKKIYAIGASREKSSGKRDLTLWREVTAGAAALREGNRLIKKTHENKALSRFTSEEPACSRARGGEFPRGNFARFLRRPSLGAGDRISCKDIRKTEGDAYRVKWKGLEDEPGEGGRLPWKGQGGKKKLFEDSDRQGESHKGSTGPK